MNHTRLRTTSLLTAGIQLSDLETLPVGVCLPLWDCVIHCQEAPPSSWPPPAYDIIGRSCVGQVTSNRSHDVSIAVLLLHYVCVCTLGRADVAKSVNMNTYTFPLKMEVMIIRAHIQTFHLPS